MAWQTGERNGSSGNDNSGNDKRSWGITAMQRGEGPTFQSQSSNTKTLPINVDLLLYRARRARRQALRAKDNQQRLELIQRAEADFRSCLDMAPSDGRAYVGLGRILVEQRRFGETIALYEEGTRLTEGRNAFLWAAWAHLESKRGNIKAARKLFDASTAANSQHAAAWHGWGLMEKRQGNIVRARDLWMQGIRQTKQNPNPYLFQSLGLLASDMGLPDEARKWFLRGTRSLQGQASHALWVTWALMEAKQGDDNAVRYLFKKCLEVGPRSRYLHLAWANWESQRGNTANARMLLERGHSLNPRDGAILQALAKLEAQRRDFKAATACFQMASEVTPRDVHVWQAWAVMEFRRGNIQRARELLQQGVWADSTSRDVAYIWQAWGVLESSAGQYQLARQLFRCAIKADPQSDPSWQAWASMESGLGYLQRANDLRKYSLESSVQVVPPRSFADPDKVLEAPLEPILQQITKWLNLFEARSLPDQRRRSSSSSKGSWWSSDGLEAKEPPLVSPSQLTPGGGVGAFLDKQEAEQMAAMAAADTIELPDWNPAEGIKSAPKRRSSDR